MSEENHWKPRGALRCSLRRRPTFNSNTGLVGSGQSTTSTSDSNYIHPVTPQSHQVSDSTAPPPRRSSTPALNFWPIRGELICQHINSFCLTNKTYWLLNMYVPVRLKKKIRDFSKTSKKLMLFIIICVPCPYKTRWWTDVQPVWVWKAKGQECKLVWLINT